MIMRRERGRERETFYIDISFYNKVYNKSVRCCAILYWSDHGKIVGYARAYYVTDFLRRDTSRYISQLACKVSQQPRAESRYSRAI